LNLAPGIKDLIEHILNEEETGSITGDYGQLDTYLDGHNGTRQITYGRSQTTEQGNLKDLIALYITKGGLYASTFRPYLEEIGKYPLYDDSTFKQTLRAAGADPIMHEAEDAFFDFDYFAPAQAWATAHGFTLALSMLVIYDSFIQSGAILDFLRARFAELPPSAGGDEKVWIENYADVRHNWLRTYNDPSNPAKSALLRTSCYRTGDLKRAIQAGNWDLSQRPIIANGAEVSA
jgi:chitosanase